MSICVVSFGAGVQSTYIAEAVIRGEMDIDPDAWIFSDTGDEPVAVYAHMERMRARIEDAGMRFVVVRRPGGQSLSEHVLSRAEAGEGGISMPPMFIKAADGEGAPVWRGCTRDFKSKVIDRWIKTEFGIPRKPPGQPYDGPVVRHILGISLDERQRQKESQEPWRRFDYPLITARIRRHQCVSTLAEWGVDAPRSACVYCPFHDAAEWRRVKRSTEDWGRAVAFERAVHAAYDEHGHVAGLKSKPYLLRSRQPLADADLRDPQLDLFGMDAECSGVCGV